MRIESTTNPRVKEVRRLHRGRERRRTGRTILEGPTLLAAALDGGVVPETVFTLAGGPLVERAADAGAAIVPVGRPVLDAISTTMHPQDPVSVIAIPGDDDMHGDRIVALVDIADPGNMGTLMRSAAAFDWHVVVTGGVDPWSPKVLRAGMGAHFARPFTRIGDPRELFSGDTTTVATVVTGGVPPESLVGTERITLLIGSEARGLPDDVILRCDASATIPMPGGFESLNAGTAGSIAMYLLGGRGSGEGSA